MNHENLSNEATESIIVECDLAEPPEKVWRALIEPELLAAWLMPNDIRPEVGTRFTFQAQSDAGGGAIECEVLTADPHRLLRYSWRGDDTKRDCSDRALNTVVTFVLTKTANGGTHLRLVHDGFPLRVPQPIARLAEAEPRVTSLSAERARRHSRGLGATPRRTVPVSSSAAQGSLRWAA